jgi:hypothetical protein
VGVGAPPGPLSLVCAQVGDAQSALAKASASSELELRRGEGASGIRWPRLGMLGGGGR